MAKTVIFLFHWESVNQYEIEIRTTTDDGLASTFKAIISELQYYTLGYPRIERKKTMPGGTYIEILSNPEPPSQKQKV